MAICSYLIFFHFPCTTTKFWCLCWPKCILALVIYCGMHMIPHNGILAHARCRYGLMELSCCSHPFSVVCVHPSSVVCVHPSSVVCVPIPLCDLCVVHYDKLFQTCQSKFQGEGPTGMLLVFPHHCLHIMEGTWELINTVLADLHSMDTSGYRTQVNVLES